MPDHWLIPPRTRSRGIPRRGAPPHLATLFEGFTAYLTVERQCRPGTLATYRWCFADFLHLAEGNPRSPTRHLPLHDRSPPRRACRSAPR